MMLRAERRGGRGHRRGRRAWRLVLGLLTAVFAFVLFAVGFVAVRLAGGPLEVEAAARIAEQVVSDALGGGRRTVIAKAEVTGSLTSGIAIRLQDIAIGEEGAGLSVRVPSASIGLQTLPLLLGTFSPSSLELEEPRVVFDLPTLDRERAARLAEADPEAVAEGEDGGGEAGPDGGAPAPITRSDRELVGASLILSRAEAFGQAVTRNLGHIRAQGLATISVRAGQLEVIRADADGTPKRVVIPEVDVTSLFATPNGDIDLGFSAKGEIGRWSMRLRYLTAPDRATHSLLFDAQDVTLRDLLGESDPELKVEMPAYPQARVDFDAADRLIGARLDLRIGAGIFRFGREPEDELLVDEGQVALSWAAGQPGLTVEKAMLQVGPSFGSVKGTITPPQAGRRDRWDVALSLDGGRFAPRDAPGPPLELRSFLLQGGYESGRHVFHVDDLQIHFGDGAMRSVGHIDFAQPKPLVVVNTVFTPVDAATVSRVWPHFVAAGARRWFIDNVRSGRVRDALAQLQFPLLVEPAQWPADAVRFSGRFEEARLHAFGDLPDITEADGRFTLANRRFEVVVDRAQAATRHPRKPSLLAFRLDVADALAKPARAAIDIRVAGDNVALGEIIDAEPLGLLTGAGIKLDGLAGTGDVRGRVELTFAREFDPKTLDYRFEAALDRFGSPSPILGRRFQDGALKVVVDRKGSTITGKAKIDGVATDVNMYEPADKTGAERRDFAMTLDDAARSRMGLDLAGLVTGPIKIEIGQPGTNDQVKHVVSDLTGARLVIPQFGWTKGAGVPAKATLDIVDEERGGARIDNFSIESEGLQVRGGLTVDKERKLASADLPRFALRRGDDARLKLQRGSDQALNVSFEAGNFDLRSLLQSLKKQGEGPEVDPKKQSDLVVKARAARLVGFNDIALTDVVIDATVRSQTVMRLQMTARAPGGRSVEISIRPDGNRRILSVNSDDAGAVLGFLDIYERLRGGSLSLSAILSGPGSADGVVKIVGFSLQPPKNQRVAALRTTNDGLREVAVRDAPITEDATFDRFQVNFAMRKGVISVSDGIAKGPATGATMSGQIDLNSQRLNVAGTFIPLYGLNNLVSRIPLFGEIVGAGRNEGLVGVTFKVVGNVDNPVLQFNPISAIAPGIFRRIFEYRVDGGRAAAPANPP